jgi:hypothetical protein
MQLVLHRGICSYLARFCAFAGVFHHEVQILLIESLFILCLAALTSSSLLLTLAFLYSAIFSVLVVLVSVGDDKPSPNL